MSKFMFIFRGGGIVVQPPPPPAEIGAHLAKWTAWVDGLSKAGHTEPGPPPLENGGKTVRGYSKTVTDGPYAETKEVLGGIGVLEARDMNHAVQLISQHPSLAYGTIWEIRPAGDMTPILKASEQRRRKENSR